MNHGEEYGIDFERLYRAMLKKSCYMIVGGFCHYHLRRDGQLTIHVLLSDRPGAGTALLERLKSVGATSLLAKCPVDLESNAWYEKKGFLLESTQLSPRGRTINIWRLLCTNT